MSERASGQEEKEDVVVGGWMEVSDDGGAALSGRQVLDPWSLKSGSDKLHCRL